MHREPKEHEPEEEKFTERRSNSVSPKSKNVHKKTPVELIALPMGMRLSDGPPPRPQTIPPPGSRRDAKKNPPPPKKLRSTNPFASFMPLSTSEREARLSLSEDEISSTIDTFSPLNQSEIPGSVSSSISGAAPPPVPRSKKKDATARVRLPKNPPNDISAKVSTEVENDNAPVTPLPPDRSALTKNLVIGAVVVLLLAVAGTLYMLFTMDEMPSPDNMIAETTDVEPSLSSPDISQANGNALPIKTTQKTGDAVTTTAGVAVPQHIPNPSLNDFALTTREKSDKNPESGNETQIPPIAPPPDSTIGNKVASPPKNETETKRIESAADETVTDAVSASEPTEPVDLRESPTPGPADTLPGGSGSPDMVIIKLNGLPDDAAVTVDGTIMDSPFEVPRSFDPIKVVVKAPDYETAVKRIVPGQDKAVLVRMTRKTQ